MANKKIVLSQSQLSLLDKEVKFFSRFPLKKEKNYEKDFKVLVKAGAIKRSGSSPTSYFMTEEGKKLYQEQFLISTEAFSLFGKIIEKDYIPKEEEKEIFSKFVERGLVQIIGSPSPLKYAATPKGIEYSRVYLNGWNSCFRGSKSVAAWM